MISNLSTRLANRLLANGTIDEQEHELYVYGLFVLLSQIIFLGITCLFGLIFGCLVQSVIFYIAFQFIRKFAGGYHARTEWQCEILSALSLLACVGVIRLEREYNLRGYLFVIASVFCIFILALCPLDTPEKPLSEKEHKYFKKISVIILIVIYALTFLSYIFELKFSFASLCMSLVLEGILIISGKIKAVLQKY